MGGMRAYTDSGRAIAHQVPREYVFTIPGGFPPTVADVAVGERLPPGVYMDRSPPD